MYRIIGFFLATILTFLSACEPVTRTPAPTPASPTPAAAATPTLAARPTGSPRAATPVATPPVRVTVTPSPSPGPSPKPTVPPVSPAPEAEVTPAPVAPPAAPPSPSLFLRKSDTLSAVAGKTGKRNLSFTFLYWNVSDRAVAPYQGDYYAYIARPGMKFIIVSYRFKNISNMEEETPDINAGQVVTQPRGFIYELWLTPPAAEAQAYRLLPSSPREVAELGGTSGGGAKLLPEKSVDGRALFEIPAEMSPVEVTLAHIPLRILLAEPSLAQPTITSQPTPASVSRLKKGETLPGVTAKTGRRNLSFTFIHWSTSDRAVALYQGVFYTYVARPGMKFIIVNYRFKNTSNMEEVTPGVNAGKIMTQPRGFIYELWRTPPAAESLAYRLSPSFPREVVELGGTSGGDVRISPEQSVDGRAVFEIPAEMTAVEATLANIPVSILLTE